MLVIFANTLLTSCVTKDVTDDSKYSELVGACKKLKIDAILGYHSRFKEYHLDPSIHDYYSRQPPAVIEKVPSGARFKVVNILHESLGEGGYCWGINVQLLDGKNTDIVAKIPACFTAIVPLWINLRSIQEGKQTQLQINKEIAENC